MAKKSKKKEIKVTTKWRYTKEITPEYSQYKLSNLFSEAIQTLSDAGWTPPVFIAVIASNGESTLGIFEEGGELGWLYRQLAEHSVIGMMHLPINVMLVNQKGEAARAYLGAEDEKPKYTFHPIK